MFLQIDNLLTQAEVASALELAARTKFIGGRRSNPHDATKDNSIQDPADPVGQQASQMVLAAIQRNDEARNFVLPRRSPCRSFFAMARE